MSQEKLAEVADLDTMYVSDVERGEENISVDALIRVAKADERAPQRLGGGPTTTSPWPF